MDETEEEQINFQSALSSAFLKFYKIPTLMIPFASFPFASESFKFPSDFCMLISELY